MGSRAQRESEQSGLNGWAIAAGIACGLVGAVAGAIGHHYLTQNEEQPHTGQQEHSDAVCGKKYSDGMCAICQAKTDEILLLPCGHEYHKSCILEMRATMRSMFCPKCRHPIPSGFLQK